MKLPLNPALPNPPRNLLLRRPILPRIIKHNKPPHLRAHTNQGSIIPQPRRLRRVIIGYSSAEDDLRVDVEPGEEEVEERAADVVEEDVEVPDLGLEVGLPGGRVVVVCRVDAEPGGFVGEPFAFGVGAGYADYACAEDLADLRGSSTLR